MPRPGPRVQRGTCPTTSASTTRCWICSGRGASRRRGMAGRSGPGSWCMLRSSCSWAARGGGVAEIQGVGPVSAEVARRLACDANVVLSVEDRDGSILDQGRARRDPTVAQRVEIARRDKGCRFPGCTFRNSRTSTMCITGPGWRDEPGQSGHAVRPAPQGRARAGVGDEGRRQLGDVLHQPARPGDEVRAVSDLAEARRSPAAPLARSQRIAPLRRPRGWVRRSGAQAERSSGWESSRQRATHPVGITVTVIRRPHSGQKRGGSSARPHPGHSVLGRPQPVQ